MNEERFRKIMFDAHHVGNVRRGGINPALHRLLARNFFHDDSKEIAGRSGDISIAGVRFYAPVKLTVGRLIRLQFCLPHSTLSLDVAAVIKDAEGFRYGTEFTKINDQERKEVERVCRILSLKSI